MDGSDHGMVEIDLSVLTRTRRKKYRWMIRIEPIDPYFCRHIKHNKGNQQTNDVGDVTNPTIKDSVTNSGT
jgi:hypothetical protein